MRVELVTVVIQVAETNITDRHEWAGFRGGEEGRKGGVYSFPPSSLSYSEILLLIG